MKMKKPYHIVFETTKKCNQQCHYCYNHWKSDEIKNYKDKEKPVKILKKLLKSEEVSHITFSGGEPGLEPHLDELIYISKINGCKVTIITNGTVIHKDLLSGYQQMGVNLFELTINGPSADIHEGINQLPGSFEKTIESITHLRSIKADVVGCIVVTKYNTATVNETIALFKSLGVRRIMLNRYNIGGYGRSHLDEIVPDKEVLQKTFKGASEVALSLGVKLYSAVCTPKCVLDPKDYQGISFSYCNYSPSRKQFTIDAYGDVRFCNHSPETIGNIKKSSIEEMMAGDYMASWSKDIPTFCTRCEEYHRCKGGCRAASEQMGLGNDTVDPLVLYYEKML